jgi:hypothetical protein
VASHHRLPGCSAVGLAQVLDREQCLAVQRRHELNARIHRLEVDAAVNELRDDDRARAAIALGAAFLGARAPQVLPQIVENGSGWRDVADVHDFAPKHEANAPARRLCNVQRHDVPPPRSRSRPRLVLPLARSRESFAVCRRIVRI